MGARGHTTGQWFATTHWTVVLQAASEPAALQEVCVRYWAPVYAFIRRSGYSVAEAQDLTQDFFLNLVDKGYLRRLSERRGKFRSFLLTILKHFLSDERDRRNALKRGGGKPLISLEACALEERAGYEPLDELSPDLAFDRRWAESILERASRALEEQYRAAGEGEFFTLIKQHDVSAGALSYLEIAARLKMTEGAVKSAVHRMRQRHQKLVYEEVVRTVGDPQEAAEELRYLIEVMSGSGR